MSKPIDKIVQHYDRQGMHCVVVNEWSEPDEPFEVYFTPVTSAEFNRMMPALKKSDAEYAAEVLRIKAKDKDGNPMFDHKDKQKMIVHGDHRVIDRVANEIISFGGEAIEDVKEP